MTCTVVLLSVILVIMACTRIEARDEELKEPREQANYHLHMLKENVDRIKRSWSSSSKSDFPWSHVSKRSTSNGADDLILNSLSSYCQAFKSDPDISEYLTKASERQPLKYRQMSEHSRYQSDTRPQSEEDNDDSEPSSRPLSTRKRNTIPVRIFAQRDEDAKQVWYIFYIAHSTTVEIARIDPLQPSQKSVLKMPRDVCYKVVSKARFVIDLSGTSCKNSNGNLKNMYATFQITDDADSRDAIIINLDLCKFDQYSSKYPKIKDEIKTTKPIIIPTFGLSQSFAPNDDKIKFQKKAGIDDSEMTYDLNIKISPTAQLSIHLALWDLNFKNVLHTSALVTMKNIRSYVSLKSVTQIQYSNIANSDKESRHPDDRIFNVLVLRNKDSKVKLRITLKKERVHNRRGRLTLSYESEYAYHSSDHIIDMIRIDRNFPINITSNFGDLPEGLVYFLPRKRLFCDEHGERKENGDHYTGRDLNCTVTCEAHGRDISTVYITTPEFVKTNVRSSSLLLPGKAVAIAKLGIYSNDVEGDYQCTVVSNRGKSYTEELKLYTSRFVNIDKFVVEKNDDETIQVLCEVSDSNENLSLTIWRSEDTKNKIRLDNLDGFYLEKNMTYDNDSNKTSLSLLLSWKQLKAPRNFLHCDAWGEIGSDARTLGLRWYTQNTKGMIPVINKKKFRLERLENATSVFTCVVRGLMPMNVFFSFSAFGKSLENLPSTSSSTRVTRDTLTFTYTIANYHIERKTAIVCRAVNELGKDWEYYHYIR